MNSDRKKLAEQAANTNEKGGAPAPDELSQEQLDGVTGGAKPVAVPQGKVKTYDFTDADN